MTSREDASENEDMLEKYERDSIEVDGFIEKPETKSPSLRVTVFTSGSCPFCDIVVELVRTVARDMLRYERRVEVIESSVDDNPELVESLGLFTLPTIQAGQMKIIGLPNTDEIEDLIHGSIIMG